MWAALVRQSWRLNGAIATPNSRASAADITKPSIVIRCNRRGFQNIAASAVIESGALIKKDVRIGHFCFVGKNVVLDDGVVLHTHSVVQGDTVVGAQSQISSFACVGGAPQNKKNDFKSQLLIGKRCMVRENVTLNVGTLQSTRVDDDVWILAGSHIGHDVHLARHVLVSGGVQIAGHAHIGEYSVIGGLCAIQQFCHIGRGSMIGGGSVVDKHIPPYSLVVGNRAKFRGINIRGLRRRGVPNSSILPLVATAKEIYAKVPSTGHQRLELAHSRLDMMLKIDDPSNDLAQEFLSFITTSGTITEGWCARRACMGVVSN